MEIDPETGRVQVIRYTAFQDVGRAIHPSYVEGQIQGGVAQGIGWAINEECIFAANGRMDNPSFLDYRMPVACDLPMIEPVMIEVPNDKHPHGIRGVGEVLHRAGAGGGGQRGPLRHRAAPDRSADVAAEGAGCPNSCQVNLMRLHTSLGSKLTTARRPAMSFSTLKAD